MVQKHEMAQVPSGLSLSLLSFVFLMHCLNYIITSKPSGLSQSCSMMFYVLLLISEVDAIPGGTVVECWTPDPKVPSSNTNEGISFRKNSQLNLDHKRSQFKKVII